MHFVQEILFIVIDIDAPNDRLQAKEPGADNKATLGSTRSGSRDNMTRVDAQCLEIIGKLFCSSNITP